MSKEIVKGICDKTNCLYDAYTKEGADKNFVAKSGYWKGDLNDIKENGFWATTMDTKNKPISDNGYVLTQRHDDTFLYQRFINCWGYGIYERYKISDTWGEWRWVTHSVEELTGSFTLKANTQENLDNYKFMMSSILVDFPKGLNKDNCVVLAAGQKLIHDTRGYGYGIAGQENVAQSKVWGANPFVVVLGSGQANNKIEIVGSNMDTSEKEVEYKITLIRTKN